MCLDLPCAPTECQPERTFNEEFVLCLIRMHRMKESEKEEMLEAMLNLNHDVVEYEYSVDKDRATLKFTIRSLVFYGIYQSRYEYKEQILTGII